MKFYLRSLLKRKVLSAITIGGFAISMAVILLLSIYVIEEKNVDTSYPNLDNIYRIKMGDDAMVPESLLEDVNNKIPGVENLCVYSIKEKLFEKDNSKQNAKFLATNDEFFDIFSYDFIYKSSDPTLKVKDHVILTHSFCKKWYGNKNPVGETFKDGWNHGLKIVGVISDPPENTSLDFDAVISLEKGSALWMSDKKDGVTHKLYKSFIQLEENVDPEAVSLQLTALVNQWNRFKDQQIVFQPFRLVYFDTSMQDDLPHLNKAMLYLLVSIGGIILLMTIFNYVNLTISTGQQRIGEVGIKKTAGAATRNIFSQFLSEALIVTFFSFCLAIFLAVLFSPTLSEILGKEIRVNTFYQKPEIFIFVFLIFFATGIISGIFPALALSRLTPLQMITQKQKTKNSKSYGVVVALQFVFTIALLISVFFIEKQIDFIKYKDLGFNKEMIVRLKLKGAARWKANVIKEKLLSNPQILAVAASDGSFMDFGGRGSWEIEEDGVKKVVDWRMFGVDSDFIELFGLEIIRGRNIDNNSENLTCLINEKLFKDYGWDSIEGKKISRGQFEVIGVVKDFHFDNLHREIGCLVLEKCYGGDVLNIKISENIHENLEFIKKCYAELEPSTDIELVFYDDWIQNMYEQEEKQAKAVKIFALFAILISCLGLIGLIEQIATNKIKEIGIRKVNGAKISEILTMLNRDFIKWVAIAFVIATPIAWYAMNKWLENFAYKTTLSWWIFVLAGVLALGIALLTVSWQSWRAATRNPVEALRYE
jgi:putative ABC transport system permease protein